MSVTPLGSGTGTEVKVLVAGSQTQADSLPMHKGPPSHIRALPLFKRIVWTATRDQFITEDHWPTTAGSLALATLTVITLETVLLAAASQARADRVCGPLATAEESQEKV